MSIPRAALVLVVVVGLTAAVSLPGAANPGSGAGEPTGGGPVLRVGDDLSGAVDLGAEGQATQTAPLVTSTVTLLTGDRVRLDALPGGGQGATILPPAGDAKTGSLTFTRLTLGGDLYVFPDAAVPYLGSTLDMRLFDVSYLARARLDDAHRATVPVTLTRSDPGTLPSLPGTQVTTTSSGHDTAEIAKDEAPQLGRLLASQWRSSRAQQSSLPAGQLSGVARIGLAATSGGPALPAAVPTASSGHPSGSGLHYRTVTLDLIDLEGTPGAGIGIVQNVDDARLGFIVLPYPGIDGPVSFSVPDGTYSIEMTIVTPHPSDPAADAALVIKPQVTVNADTTITLDARSATQYQATLDEPVPPTYHHQDILTFSRTSVAGGGFGIDGFGFNSLLAIVALHLYSINETPKLFATPTPPVTEGFLNFNAFTQWTPDQALPSAAPRYVFTFPHAGTIPASLTYHVRKADMTTVHEGVYGGLSGGDIHLSPMVYLPWTQDSMGVDAAVPRGARTDYWYSAAPDITVWQNRFVGTGDRSSRTGLRRMVRPGQEIREVWGKAPQGVPPVAPHAQQPAVALLGGNDSRVTEPFLTVCPACRQGDNGMVYLTAFGDSDDAHYAESRWVDRSELRFFRDGIVALNSDAFTSGSLAPWGVDLPLLPDTTTYRLEWKQASARDTVASNTTAWTFTSGPDDAPAAIPPDEHCAPDTSRGCSFLPLLFIRYDLALDFQSRATADAPFDISFAVTGQQHAPEPQGLSATVAASFDDGKTWTAAQTAQPCADGTFAVTIDHPPLAATSGFVSLRVHARDAAGDAVDQTIIRAYGLTD